MWNPNPSNSVRFRADTMALFFEHDPDFPNRVNVCILHRASIATDWVRAGNILSGVWQQDVDRFGGWANWITYVRNVANGIIHEQLGDFSPVPPADPLPPGVPTNFDDCKAWMAANVYAIDEPAKSNLYLGTKPEEPEIPEPAPGGFVANKVFRVGKQLVCLNLQVEANGESTISFQRQVGNGWQKVGIA